jgi:signal transduction histidine kinase
LIDAPDQKVSLAAGTFVDIDTLKQVEEDLRRRTLEAQGVSKAKSRFISSMSHELRTPLNSIHGFAQLLRLQTTDDQEDAKSLDEILAASQHLAHLVDDLLDWSSLQAETPRLQMRVLEVNGLMRECAEMVRSQAEAAGLDLQLQITSPALSVLADARRLRQILLNLLSNAIKYNRPHGRLLMGAVLGARGASNCLSRTAGRVYPPSCRAPCSSRSSGWARRTPPSRAPVSVLPCAASLRR